MIDNESKKFDVVLMNPPYGSTGGDIIHLRFVDKCLDIANHQITVMPFTFITKVNHKSSKKYKEKFNPYLSEVEEIDSKEFADTNMANVGIYVFGDKTQHIDIKYVNSPKESINSLLNKSEFTNYEKEFIKYLEKHGQQECYNAGNHSHCTKKSLARQGITDSDEAQKIINKNILDNSKHLKENRIYLMVNVANGGMNGTAISSKTGEIYKSVNELKEEFIRRNQSTGYNVFAFDTINEAKNCKIALQNPLLRFTIYRTQNDQNMMISRVYKYIPNINWEDPRVKTDEGLLEVCGCPKDKCKEYADYCKKIIEEVDKKKK